ncbi:MFS transporter [Thiospirochaeta perfilievii]|uniref:MFS transporter n=1 Tax=Thiospirochaeta perfilievii TaxID=252967 RepID=A0A5C1Q801_9SPIO|nr:MFS transporter [Thiospirochaeta perfilievii]QEN03170.1 MFS transporter [Thiospirochaeta perfilievii]
MKSRSLKSLLIILLVSFGHFWHDIFTAFVIPLLPVLKDNFQLDYLHAGWILVAVRIPSLLSANIAEYAEKHNPKWFVIFCPLITSISISLLGLAPNFYIVMGLVLISGISAAGFHVPAPTLLKRSAPNRIGMAMTAFQIGGEAARTLGPIIIVLILSTIGFKNMFILIPVSMLVSLGFYLSFRKVDISLDIKEKKKGSIIETFKDGKLLFILVAGISVQKALISTIFKSFLPLYLQSHGESLLSANGALAVVQGATVAGVIVSGIMIDKIGPKKILYVILTAATIFVTMYILIPSLPLYPMLILIGFFSFASMPAIYTLIQGHGFDFPTTANGIFMSLNFGITSILLIVGGKLSDLLSIDTTYYILGLSTLIGLPLLLLLKKTKVK